MKQTAGTDAPTLEVSVDVEALQQDGIADGHVQQVGAALGGSDGDLSLGSAASGHVIDVSATNGHTLVVAVGNGHSVYTNGLEHPAAAAVEHVSLIIDEDPPGVTKLSDRH
ncbi:Cytoplasmic tRNA 2-thiolation protein 2 [Frankliniella fusca]|uniref:Cytoplasmic tRNA 2-thiolation protein 2 n=1 Tax=Frankliniella fusca TaxID=407009 RepID=A0AAE1GY96_9NEOP|nr:Cytoplasmic tRNA 2-thiolation protein 2 [Frankliniella fusca]